MLNTMMLAIGAQINATHSRIESAIAQAVMGHDLMLDDNDDV